jgi:hypothetical protein
MAVPNTFASATSPIPLANLDANFAYYDAAYSISGANITYLGTTTAGNFAYTWNMTTAAWSVGAAQTTGTITFGGTAGTGVMTFGQSTAAQTINFGTGATTTGVTKAINIGTAGASGSITTINIGSATAGATGITNINSQETTVNGFSATAPITINAATYTQLITDYSLIVTTTAPTITLLAAASYAGKVLFIKNITATAVISASSNVVPLGSATAGTAILAATVGKFAMLQSDGTNWVTMMAN